MKKIAQELVDQVKENTTIDWTIRESVKAKMRILVKRILRKYDYPPDKQKIAIEKLLRQAELFSLQEIYAE